MVLGFFYERTEVHGSVLQWGLDGHGWVLHCSRSGGLSWISQLRSLKRSPFGRWHTTSLVFIPPPHGFVHWGRHTERSHFIDASLWIKKKELTAMFSCQNMPVLCETTLVCPSYLSPAAIHPLWTWPRFAGSLLAGSAAIFTAVGRVAVLILAHYHTPLEASCTCAGALFLCFFNRDKRAQK